MRRTLSILGIIAAVPLMAMSSSKQVYVDTATEVPMPVCNLEYCDHVEGRCEGDAGYHLPPPVENELLAVAREASTPTVVYAE